MIETLRRICELQPRYVPENTAEMQERGRLIRQVLRDDIAEMAPALREALGAFGDEFDVEGSDGIGRKTQAPWTRFFAKSMSPSAREGFYVVLHFAADGSAAFITVGCGATTWANGELTPFSDDDLHGKTEWARTVISERFGSTQPFSDQIDLGAKAPLPKAFEKATAVAKRLPVGSLRENEVRELLVAAAARLKAIYDAQRLGGDLSLSDLAQIELEQIARPARQPRVGGGQGFRLSQVERVAIEMRAMDVSRQWLEEEGYVVKDTSKNSPFDFEAVRGAECLKVEVKGTTAAGVDSIFMTKNELTLHRSEKGRTALLIVSQIGLTRLDNAVTADAGVLTAVVGWDIDLWEATPIAFQLRRPA